MITGSNYNRRTLHQQRYAGFETQTPKAFDRVCSVAMGAVVSLALVGLAIGGLER